MGFYDMTQDQRVALVTRAVAERRTVFERWNDLGVPEASPWSARSVAAARLLDGCRSVADLGCGLMGLRAHLAPGTRYVPVDVVSRSADTVVVDLNSSALPVLDVQGFALLGLIEYLFDVPGLLRQLHGTVVVSYNPLLDDGLERMAHAWVNAYDVGGLEALFRDSGWVISERLALGREQIWRLVK